MRSCNVTHTIREFGREDAEAISHAHDWTCADWRIVRETAGILEAEQTRACRNRAFARCTDRADEADLFTAREEQRHMRAR